MASTRSFCATVKAARKISNRSPSRDRLSVSMLQYVRPVGVHALACLPLRTPNNPKVEHRPYAAVMRVLLVFAWAAVAHAEITVRWLASKIDTNTFVVVVSGVKAPAKP